MMTEYANRFVASVAKLADDGGNKAALIRRIRMMAKFEHTGSERGAYGFVGKIPLANHGSGSRQNVRRVTMGDVWECNHPRSRQRKRRIHATWTGTDSIWKGAVD